MPHVIAHSILDLKHEAPTTLHIIKVTFISTVIRKQIIQSLFSSQTGKVDLTPLCKLILWLSVAVFVEAIPAAKQECYQQSKC